jgi:hypothetical protein
MLNESMVNHLKRIDCRSYFLVFRITGEPLFVNSADGLMYSEQFGFGNSNEPSPSAAQAGAVGFDFPSHATDVGSILSAAIGHQQILHGIAGLNQDESDNDDMSEDYADIDDDDDDDEQSNGDESSQGELDE